MTITQDNTEQPSMAIIAEAQQASIVQQPTQIHQAPSQRPLVPEWYQSIESMLLIWAAKGVSDVQMVSDQNVWLVERDEHIQTNVILQRDHILALANYWQPEDRTYNQDSGSHILVNGKSGILELMKQIGEWRARIIFRRQESGFGVTMRFIPPNPPSLESNPQPQQVLDLLTINNGLFIVSGPTGSGKTTLLATLINEYNRLQHKHILTIEDPIEFVHRPINSLITQMEVGRDVDSFAGGIKAAVRSKAQVILVGELRELDAIEAALDAANKGHLVFATAHASSASQCIESMVSNFPGDKQNLIKNRIAEVMKIVMVQRLVPNINGKLIPVREIMLDHTTTSPRIREGKFNELTGALKKENNMISFETSLYELYEQNQITEETAMKFANVKDDLIYKIQRLNERRQNDNTTQPSKEWDGNQK